jgi:hypothetical protein
LVSPVYVLKTLYTLPATGVHTDEPTSEEGPDPKRAKCAQLLPPVTALAIHDTLASWPGHCMVKEDLRGKLRESHSIRRFGIILLDLKKKRLVKEEERRVSVRARARECFSCRRRMTLDFCPTTPFFFFFPVS